MIKTSLKLISSIYLLLLIVSFFTGCEDDKDDIAPGLYVEETEIETFPGDTVLVNGTVSNYVGLSSITLSCEEWEINKIYDLSAHKPVVFNYYYQMIVPQTATFDQELLVTVRDKNGLETQKVVALSFLPDTESPVVTQGIPSQVSVDFDTSVESGLWTLNMKFSDDRELKQARVQIPDVAVDESYPVSGRSGSLNQTIEFTSPGSFPATITIDDASGNETVVQTEVVVMLTEEEDPIQDYAQMYVVNADENADDYLNGYYRYMDRQGEYQYQGVFYSPSENTPVYFVPAKTMDSDLFGVSPYVSSKLMNKNGYVEPVLLPAEGYYGIWIDLNTHTYSIWSLEVPAGTYNGELGVSGTGFTIGDWALPAENMNKVGNGYQYEYEMELVADYSGKVQYYFYSPDWVHIYRADVDGNWWYESATGGVVAFDTEYAGKVKITFDTAYPWATMKKVTQ
ncbi:hypothetical protein [Mangrovibacterium lignilyticum]|uniref:hypothetical protein n=1 Tax=Mangrovibacterium lignilyticum TaxID=2668052 RepID=UPI0013D38C87|nr:hypothetical protein [Mangrovibacterium lignilyticum]